ncbi:hypothetical protein CDO52_00040 [Nocardiopsis gilva YIM 90087]|uniref:Uncharacterized protein n=2 Tax=Nocardiopsis gilva TaxID=280236 RepID=A0A223RZS1_9ACTN|nr:hypothetical protein [Nocardiopsis gilva]ASU81383.1 hypothetical protein CDO52_00040 [Nocardiopsis gilva YIM 90087]
MAAAEQAAGDDVAAIDLLIARAAATGKPFSANDIRAQIPDDARTAAIGARFAHARRRGVIEPIGYVTSTDPGTHAHQVRQWQGARR